MKAIVLARVSSKEQEDNNSIPAQTRRLHEYAERTGLDISDTYQLVESSTKANRQKFNELIKLIENSNEVIALVVDTIDRLQRGFRESVLLDELRAKGKVELHFVRENLVISRLSNSADILRWDMGVMFAKSYVAQLSDNVRRSQEQKVRNGEWLSKAPFGYRNVGIENGKRWIEPDPEAAHIVLAIYEWYATESYSLREIRKKLLNNFALKKATGAIDALLKNSFYYGVMRIKDKEYEHVYEQIITKELFNRARQVREGFNKKSFKYGGLPYFYRGLIRCGKCGCSITPEKSKGHVYYHCTQYYGKHSAAYIREEDLTEQLKLAFTAIQLSEDQLDIVMNILKSSQADRTKYRALNIATLQTELSKVNGRLERLLEAHLDGEVDRELYQRKSSEYKSAKANIKARLAAIDTADNEFYTSVENLLKLANKAPHTFESSEIEQRRLLINLVLQNLKLNDRKLSWEYKKPFDTLYQTAFHKSWNGTDAEIEHFWQG